MTTPSLAPTRGRGPVRPSGRWMLARAHRMWSDPAGFLLSCQTELGDVVELPVPGRPVVVVSDPEAALRVLQGNHPAYGKDTVQYRALAQVTGEGLLVADGDAWRGARRVVQPAFGRDAHGVAAGHAAEAALRLAEDWAGRPYARTVDVDAALMRLTLELVGRTLFSTDLGSEAARIVPAVVTALDVVVARARWPLAAPASVPTPANLRLRRAVATLDSAVAAVLAGRRARRPPEPGGALDSCPPDVLGLLLASGMPDSWVRDQVVTLVVAGHETVASALTWACWLVAGHPEVQRRLAAEADDVLGGRVAGLDDCARLPYARQVLDETLRLYPPAWVVSRRALADDELAGVAVSEGSLVIVSPYALQRDARVWPRPAAFDPGRFDRGAGGGGPGPADGSYLPFGAGPRLCVGRELALVQGVLVLATLAGRVRLRPVPGAVVRAHAGVTLRPRGGLRLRVEGRDGAPHPPATG